MRTNLEVLSFDEIQQINGGNCETQAECDGYRFGYALGQMVASALHAGAKFLDMIL